MGNQQFQVVGLNLLPTCCSTSDGDPSLGLSFPIYKIGIGLSDVSERRPASPLHHASGALGREQIAEGPNTSTWAPGKVF